MVCNAGVDIFCRSDKENKGSTTKEDGVEGSGCAQGTKLGLSCLRSRVDLEQL